MDLEPHNFNLTKSGARGSLLVWTRTNGCVRLPVVGYVTTACLHSVSWYSAYTDMSGIDIPQMIKDFEGMRP